VGLVPVSPNTSTPPGADPGCVGQVDSGLAALELHGRVTGDVSEHHRDAGQTWTTVVVLDVAITTMVARSEKEIALATPASSASGVHPTPAHPMDASAS